MLKTVKSTVITGTIIAVIIVTLLNFSLEDLEWWKPNIDAAPLRGDQRRAIVVVEWAPEMSGVMDVQVFYNQSTLGTGHFSESPMQEHREVEVGTRIEVRAHKHGTRPNSIQIVVTIQTPEGDYVLKPLLCTEPTVVQKVCVGVVPR